MTLTTLAGEERRTVYYDDYQDLLRDAERLLACEVRTLGNWSAGQIMMHLAEYMHMSIDGAPYRASWPARHLHRAFFRERYLGRPHAPGYQLPPKAAELLVPEPTSAQAGFAALRQAVHRLLAEDARAEHPLLGPLSSAEWDRAHLRHAELHMSFLRPM